MTTAHKFPYPVEEGAVLVAGEHGMGGGADRVAHARVGGLTARQLRPAFVALHLALEVIQTVYETFAFVHS